MRSSHLFLPDNGDLYRLIFDNTYQFIGLLDPQGLVLEVNQPALLFVGVTREAVVGHAVWDTPWFSAASRLRLREAVAQAAQGAFVHDELDIIGEDGRVVNIDFSLRPLLDEAGAVVYLIPEGRAVSERRQTEASLALELAQLGTWSWDPVRDQVQADARCREICGLEPEAPLSLGEVAARIHHGDGSRVELALAAAVRPEGTGRYAEEFRFVHPDGAVHWVVARGQALFEGEGEARRAQQLVGTVLDITERKAAEAVRERLLRRFKALSEALEQRVMARTAVLRESEARFATLFYASPLPVVLTTLVEGCILDLNLRAEASFGYSREEAIGRTTTELKLWTERPLGGRMEMLECLQTQGGLHDIEGHFRRKDGELREVLASFQLVEVKGEACVLTILVDVTERKRAEAALRESETRLRHAALHDPLTGLPLRTLFADRLEHAVARATRDPEHRYAVLFIDLDGFKAVNDTLGHAAGDELLVTLARRLTSCVRESDTVARLGGDEFVVLLEDLAQPDEALRLAERVLQELTLAVPSEGGKLSVSASIGVALSDGQHTGRSLLQAADTAMYRAKAAGKGRYWVFEEPSLNR